jgi:hypothetical protein
MPRSDESPIEPADEFESLLSRIEMGTATKADFQQLREALAHKSFQEQLGKYNINIGQGREIQIGDRT